MPEPVRNETIGYWVLGPLLIRDSHNEIISVNSDKLRRLLTELLHQRNTWVDTDALIDSLWRGTEPPASAKGNIKTYIHQLRQLLPGGKNDSPISSRKGSYQLTVRHGQLDTDVFEELIDRGRAALRADEPAKAAKLQQQALDLWRGSPEHDEDGFASVEAARLGELRWVARDALADALIASGHTDQALVMLRGLTTENPLREATWARLITALRTSGRPGDALAAYHEIRTILVDELGAEPGATLRASHAAALAETEGDTPAQAPVIPSPQSERRASVPGWRSLAVRVTAVVAALAMLVTGSVVVVNWSGKNGSDHAGVDIENGIAPPRPVPGYPSGTPEHPRVLFGLGPEATTAARKPLANQTPVGMFTTWYDGPDELARYASWRQQVVPKMYDSGKALHLLIAPDHQRFRPGPVPTQFGPGCGMAYPLKPEFLDHMRQLARSFAGQANGPPLYVSVFNGLLKVACTEDGYNADPSTANYYHALKKRYLEVRQIFHEEAPNARVALNWDGWQASHDDPELGAGLSMMRFFSDAMAASDFQSFNAFENKDNADDVSRMVAELGQYGPVMVSNFGPYDSPQWTRSDLNTVFTDERLRKLTAQGLFAWSFWEQSYLETAPDLYPRATQIVNRYASR